MGLPRNGIVCDGNLAVKLADLLCDALYDDVTQQRPFSVREDGTCWRIEGSRNRDGALNDRGEFFLSMEKSDGRVSDIGELMRCQPHPSVVPVINEHFAQHKPQPNSELDNPLGAENKSQSGMLLLIDMARGGVVFCGDLAIKIGELLCEAHYGDLSRQVPLDVHDKQTCWRVEGGWNRDGNVHGSGPFHMSIQKYDARVTDFGQ
jgi:hypothetical protein